MLKFFDFSGKDYSDMESHELPKKLSKLPEIKLPKFSPGKAAKAVKSATSKYGDARLGMKAAGIKMKRRLKGAALAVEVNGKGILDRLHKVKKVSEPAATPKASDDTSKLRKLRRNKKGG